MEHLTPDDVRRRLATDALALLPMPRERSAKDLGFTRIEERQIIELMWQRGLSKTIIAAHYGCHRITISRMERRVIAARRLNGLRFP